MDEQDHLEEPETPPTAIGNVFGMLANNEVALDAIARANARQWESRTLRPLDRPTTRPPTEPKEERFDPYPTFKAPKAKGYTIKVKDEPTPEFKKVAPIPMIAGLPPENPVAKPEPSPATAETSLPPEQPPAPDILTWIGCRKRVLTKDILIQFLNWHKEKEGYDLAPGTTSTIWIKDPEGEWKDSGLSGRDIDRLLKLGRHDESIGEKTLSDFKKEHGYRQRKRKLSTPALEP